MPFCENCGNKVSETAKFCSSCGEKLNQLSLESETTKKPLSNEGGEEAQMKNVQLQEIFTSLIAHKRSKDPFPNLPDNPRYDFGSPIKPKDGAGIR